METAISIFKVCVFVCMWACACDVGALDALRPLTLNFFQLGHIAN